MKARSFRREEKERLKGWLLRVYRDDHFPGPPPAVRAGRFLTVRDALAQAGRTVAARCGCSAIVPLGHHQPSVTTYKLIKWSAFVFRTARQRDRVLKDWRRLVERTQCGPELLALRRTFGGRLTAVAKRLFELIRAGDERLNRLNVDKLWRPNGVGLRNGQEVRERRDAAQEQFTKTLAAGAATPRPRTGLVVDRLSLAAVRAASALVRW
jgi:hypothetical protein